MDDLDDLLNSLGGPSVAAPHHPQQTFGAYPPQQQTSFAPAPSAGGDDLDDLLNELGGGGAPPPQQAQPQRSFAAGSFAAPAPAPAPVAAPAAGDDLDDLLNELGGAAAPPAMPPRNQPQQPQRSFAAAPAPVAAGGDDLDDLLNELGGGGASAPPAMPPRNQPQQPQRSFAAAPAPVAAGGDDLDDLLNELGSGSSPARHSPQVTQPQSSFAAAPASQPQRSFAAAPAPAAGGDDLDDLLNELGGGAPPPQQTQPQRSFAAAPVAAPAPVAGGDDLDSLLNELGGGAPPPQQTQPQRSFAAAPAAAPAPVAGGDDLDSLLNELGAPPAQSRSSPARGGYNPASPAASSPARGGYNASPAAPSPARGGYNPTPAGGGDDLDMMLKGLSNQMADIDDGAPAARGVCHTCHKPILGEIIQAMNKAFHPECFICGNCQDPLGTRNFYEHDGRPHCEKCYQSLFCSLCAHCNKPVLDRCINAMGKKWHVDHFICAKCSAPFPDGMFFEKEGRPWCKNCYSQNFSYRCGMCNQGITGDVVNALGRHWHPQCFVCVHCRMPFEGGTFFAKEGKPYCRQHYSMQSGATCGGCGQPITGGVVDGLGRKWHPQCFVCAFCNNPLTGGGYQEHESRPYCRGCSQRMF